MDRSTDWIQSNHKKQTLKANSVPSTPILQHNHFNILSPTTTHKKNNSKKYKKSKRSQSVRDDQQVPEQPAVEDGVRSVSFLDYLRDELTVADFDSAQELKRERVTNFLSVPGAIEKVRKRKKRIGLRLMDVYS